MSEISKKVEEMAKPIIEEMGFELVDVSYQKTFGGMELNLSIYKENGKVSIEDCEKISHALDLPLEELNPTNDKPYSLVVGSLGLDRLMIKTRDFERNIGKEIEIKLFSPLNGVKEICGKLTSISEEEIEIEKQNEKLTIARKNISSAKLYIKF